MDSFLLLVVKEKGSTTYGHLQQISLLRKRQDSSLRDSNIKIKPSLPVVPSPHILSRKSTVCRIRGAARLKHVKYRMSENHSGQRDARKAHRIVHHSHGRLEI